MPLKHDGCVVPICPFCEKELDGVTVNGLHAECNDQYNRELAEWEQAHNLSGQNDPRYTEKTK